MHNERRCDGSVSITECKEFEGRPHFPGAPGWEEVGLRDRLVRAPRRAHGNGACGGGRIQFPGDGVRHYEADSPAMYPMTTARTRPAKS